MSVNDLASPKASKISPTPSSKSEKIDMEKSHENLSDYENLSEFDSDSECESAQNGKNNSNLIQIN